MTGERPIGEDDLQAFVDGRLPPPRREAVKAYLAEHPATSEQVEREIELREALRARLAFKAREPIPSRLRVANLVAARRRRSPLRPAAFAAVLAWLAIGGVLGAWGGVWWASRAQRQAEAVSVADNAIAAHRIYVSERLHPVEVPAEQEAHLVQWLSRRVGKPLTAPNLNAQGYRLIGGRLLPDSGEAAALFMYENGGGNRLTLYARSGDEAQTSFQFEERDGVSAFSWIENGLSYVVTAKADRAQLLPIAEAIYKQFAATGDPAKGRL
ncbi:anti-sigma factor family protein [Microvirga lotononidis]|uniref:Putative transmembrane transcriptional regulator (Anti-sigma factor) n=1 Tax=Microvirga lotononidis TaxID=864069 RepID=I4YV04_9HYPH|nr:anti-sigma factor [Microvirga lotononidis]EIM27796.1 putative transmembrane transcriptional regulator (anti-sigma factor) [Microvirga lotononidis]WQO28071.1 anti-sigma factor [Microvirga lotononidis]